MKNTYITALVAILGLAFVGASSAQTTNAPATTAPASSTAPAVATKAKKAAKTAYKGTISAIDASSVTVVGKSKTYVMAIAPTTTYKVDKASSTLAAFAVNDVVTGSYTTDATGALTAASLHKKTTAAKTAAAPATTPAPAAQ